MVDARDARRSALVIAGRTRPGAVLIAPLLPHAPAWALGCGLAGSLLIGFGLAVAKGVTAFEPAAAGRFLALPTGTGRMMDVDQAAKAMKEAEIEADWLQ